MHKGARIMKVLKVISVASAICLAFAGICLADTVYPTGTVTPINTVSSSAVTTLDFDSAGANVVIDTITISNNYEWAFNLTLAFTNGGNFYRVSASGDGTTCTGSCSQVPITTLQLVQHGSGTLGTGLTPPSGTFTLTPGTPPYYTWSPGTTQTTATVGYQVDVLATWAQDSSRLEGTYKETLTATLTVGDGS